MKNTTIEELAGTWAVMAEMEPTAKPGRRETLRECADALRMLVSMLPDDGACSVCQNLDAQMRALAKERDELRAEVREWLCDQCNHVYPGPPAAGLACVTCTNCGGTTGPRGAVERRRLQRQLDAVGAAPNEPAPGGVYITAEGRAFGRVSDEQITVVLEEALADVRKRSGLVDGREGA